MKRIALIMGVAAILLTSCKDKFYTKYYSNVPVYTDYETFRSSGGFEAPRSIERKGNIYFKDDYLFMVEPDKGIHFINNTNPSSPTQTGFLSVWGATGMAIRGDYLYVNSFIDLIVYDISSLSNPIEVNRLEDVFPTALPFSDKNYPYQEIDKERGVVTSWEVKEVKEEVAHVSPFWANCPNCETIAVDQSAPVFAIDKQGGGSVGIAGSITLFTIINDYLYIIEEGTVLNPIELTNPVNPVAHEKIGMWREIETLFPYEDHIFMGTPSGMLVYSTDNPKVPAFISSIDHARGCDPVVVQNDYAYVTVRSGGPCGGNINQLDVIDVSDFTYPVLKASFNMKDPHGLGISNDRLFICDGSAGLKVFDASNPVTAGDHLLYKFGSIQATDIIPINDIAMVIGDDGIYQYDYSNPDEMILISKIAF